MLVVLEVVLLHFGLIWCGGGVRNPHEVHVGIETRQTLCLVAEVLKQFKNETSKVNKKFVQKVD